MDIEKVSPSRRKVLDRIARYEYEGRFDEDVEDDPPAPELVPGVVDYTNKKLKNRIIARYANKLGDRFFTKQKHSGVFYIDAVTGRENLTAAKSGAVFTCNHFNACDSYVLSKSIEKELPRHRLWKIIREGNYTNFDGPKLFAYLFRHAYTLPLSSNRRAMVDLLEACNTLLERGESILVFAEQGMWWNYRKPRPMKSGAFRMAVRANVPVVPAFITMTDDERLDGDGYPVQHYTLHILPAIYPDGSLPARQRAEKMRQENERAVKELYERVYKIPLTYTTKSAEEEQ